MILPADALVAWYAAVAAHYNRVALCDAAEVHRCCARAATLAEGDPASEPAAMFFAFADKRRAFPFAWKLMAAMIAEVQASANGLSVEAEAAAYDELCVAVLHRRVGWPEVKAWFAPRVRRTPP